MSDQIDYRLGDWAQNKSFAAALAAAGSGGGVSGYYVAYTGAVNTPVPPLAGENPFPPETSDPLARGRFGYSGFLTIPYFQYQASGEVLTNFDEFNGFYYAQDGVYLNSFQMAIQANGATTVDPVPPGAGIRVSDNQYLDQTFESYKYYPGTIQVSWTAVQVANDYNFYPAIQASLTGYPIKVYNSSYTVIRLG